MTIILSITIIVGLMLLWAFIQDRWKKSFPKDILDEDALAGRTDCGNCGCKGACVNHNNIVD